MGTNDIAALLSVSVNTVRKWCNEGMLKCHMVGTHRRVLRADLITFILQHGLEKHSLRVRDFCNGSKSGLFA